MLGLLDLMGGSGGVPALLVAAHQDSLPSITQAPLWSYYIWGHRGEVGLLAPVDYCYFEWVRAAFDWSYGTEHAAAWMAYCAGISWWGSRYTVLDHHWSIYCLEYLVGGHILQHLRATDQADSQIFQQLDPSTKRDWYHRQSIARACQIFCEEMQQQGGIQCHYQKQPAAIEIHFVDCPFCANQRRDCNVLLGTLHGMILWLYGKKSIAQVKKNVLTSFALYTQQEVDIQRQADDSHACTVRFL
jgi:hypothetical protein